MLDPRLVVGLPENSIGNDSWERSNATRNRYVFLYYGVTF